MCRVCLCSLLEGTEQDSEVPPTWVDRGEANIAGHVMCSKTKASSMEGRDRKPEFALLKNHNCVNVYNLRLYRSWLFNKYENKSNDVLQACLVMFLTLYCSYLPR